MTREQEKTISEGNDRHSNEAWRANRKTALGTAFAMIASGALLSTAFPPLNWSFSAWVALAPLYFVASRLTPWRAFRVGFLWGLAWALPSFFWLREISILIPFAMAPMLALYPAAWAAVVPIISKNLLVPLDIQLAGSAAEKKLKPSGIKLTLLAALLAAAWCALEWLRSWIFTGLPWNLLGISQWKVIPIIQIAEYTGVYGVSFLIVYVNIALSMTVDSLRKTIGTGKYRRPVPMMVGMTLVMTTALVGFKATMKWNLPEKDVGKRSVKITVVQGDIEQCRFASDAKVEEVLKTYLDFSELAILNNPDLMVWPETAVPIPYRDGYDSAYKYRFGVFKLLEGHRTKLMIGSIDYDYDNARKYRKKEDVPSWNSVFLIEPGGKTVAKYNKIHLVPFGEYVPLGKLFPWLVDMIGMGRGLTPGRKFALFDIAKGAKAGVCVCYEDIFPEIARGFVRRGANILINITNDAWYPTSSEPEQHLANAVFRAIETRRPLLRAGNNSCSCLILPSGLIVDSVVSSVAPDGSSIPRPTVKCRGFGAFQVLFDSNPPLTFNTRYGDLFAWLCAALLAAALLRSAWNWKDRRRAVADAFDKKHVSTGTSPKASG
jgi:apolipoprotein N-acyltransferase